MRALTTGDQRGGILALITAREDFDQHTTVDDITKTLYISPRTVQRRAVDLTELGYLDREWMSHHPCPRYRLTQAFDKHVGRMLERVVYDAGPKGTTRGEAGELLLNRVITMGAFGKRAERVIGNGLWTMDDANDPILGRVQMA